MSDNSDLLNDAVSLIAKAALLAARFSGRVRRLFLVRLAAMDIDSKVKEFFLRDKIHELRLQVSIFQKRISRSNNNPRYSLRERFLILWCFLNQLLISKPLWAMIEILFQFSF